MQWFLAKKLAKNISLKDMLNRKAPNHHTILAEEMQKKTKTTTTLTNIYRTLGLKVKHE